MADPPEEEAELCGADEDEELEGADPVCWAWGSAGFWTGSLFCCSSLGAGEAAWALGFASSSFLGWAWGSAGFWTGSLFCCSSLGAGEAAWALGFASSSFLGWAFLGAGLFLVPTSTISGLLSFITFAPISWVASGFPLI